MKVWFVAVAFVMSLSLVKNRPISCAVTLTPWPQGPHFYLGEPMVLVCTVERNSSEVWTYSWFRHDLSKAVSPGRAHRVSHHIYSISALTPEDGGSYRCGAQKPGANVTLLSEPVSLSVSAAAPPASLDVWPESSQHLRDAQFSLRCSVHGGEAANWSLRRLRGAEVTSGCVQMEGRVDPEQADKCSFNNITAGLSGLYWCGAARGDQRSKAVTITVSDGHVALQTPVRPVTEGQPVTLQCKTSYNLTQTLIYKDGASLNDTSVTAESVTKAHEGFYKCVNPTAAVEGPESWLSVTDHLLDQTKFIAAWAWPVGVISVALLLSIATVLLVPGLRKKVKLFPACGEFNAHQEMPRTKQDMTEIQWDLAWMEMSNLLDKPQPNGAEGL